jgi:hypothetical protein
MGWEESTPLEQDQIRSQDKAVDLLRPLNGNEASFLAIDILTVRSLLQSI